MGLATEETLLKIAGVGDADTTGGLANALLLCAAGADSPASVSFYNNTAGTLCGALVNNANGGVVPPDGSAIFDAVKLLAGERKTIDFACRTNAWALGGWAILSSTAGTITIASGTAGYITRTLFPT